MHCHQESCLVETSFSAPWWDLFLFNSQHVQAQVKIIDLARCVLPKQTSVCDLGSSPSLDVATHGLLVKMARKKNAIFKIKIAFVLVFIMVAMEIM